MALPKVDVVIVGLGAAGGVLAKELSTNGLKVVGLDLGPFRRTIDFQSHDELRFSARLELLEPKLSDPPMRLVSTNPTPQYDRYGHPVGPPIPPNPQGSPARSWTISVGVGGGSIHYGTWNWRPLPHHFKIKSDNVAKYGASSIPAGTNIVDWPITYDDLAPYYDKVDTEIGISGKAGNIKGQIQSGGNPFEGPRNADFPLPPLNQTTTAQMFAKGAAALGYKPFPTPSAIISRDYDGRPACTYCGFCSSYGCHVGAKSSTMVSVIPKAVASGNFEIRPYCRVIKVNKASDRATSVTYIDANGNQQEQPAGLIVLSNYTFDVVRQLLWSGINANGMVGKYFMSHNYVFVFGTFDNNITNPSEGQTGANTTIDEFNGDNFDHTGLGFIEGASITSLGGNSQAISMSSGALSPDAPQWGQAYKDYIKKYGIRYAGLIAQNPQLPYDANFLELDPNVKDQYGVPVIRIHYDGFDNEKKSGTYLQDKMEPILKQMGATKAWRGPTTIPPFNNHEVGGCRMGDDPSAAVVNKYGQSHELPNLFVASGAVFPTYFGYNPTHTIEAFSYWEGAYINQQVKSGGSLSKYLG